MGFTKDAAVSSDEITVSMAFRVINKDVTPPAIEDVDVLHAFMFPTTRMREKHQSEIFDVRGRKMKARATNANWNLWRSAIKYVEGYDDLPREDQTAQTLAQYFSDSVGRLHVDEAVGRLLEDIAAEDGNWKKKSEQ